MARREAHEKDDPENVAARATDRELAAGAETDSAVGAGEGERSRKLEQDRSELESLTVLAAGLGHELNNLLTVILAGTEFVRHSAAADSAEAEALADVRGAADRAANLCKQMLAFAGERSLANTPVVLADAIEAAVRDAALPGRVGLAVDLPDDLPAIGGDPRLLVQLFRSLLENSLEAIGDGDGTISVRAEVGGAGGDRQLSIEIADDGAGMSEETRTRAFVPFFSTKFAGRGLGLAAALGIVRSHNGSIELAERAAGGTMARVVLPASTIRQPTAPTIRGRTAVRRGRARVLVVDDEAPILRSVRRTLGAAGYEVVAAADGNAALDCVRESDDTFDLVVLDLMMPGMDGVTAFYKLRELQPDIRILLSSGYHHFADADELIAEGLCGFLRKPYMPEALLARVGTALES